MVAIICISCVVLWLILGAISAGVYIGHQSKDYVLTEDECISVRLAVILGAISFLIVIGYIITVLSERLTRKIRGNNV